MIRSFYAVLIFLLMPLSVLAESPPVEQTEPAPTVQAKRSFMDQEQRQGIYDQEKKEVLAAVGYSLLLPGLGNLYAEQYFVGALVLSLMGFALTFAGYAITTDQSEFFVWAGVTAGVAYATGITTSAIGVKRYNENLSDRLNLSLVPTRHVPSVSIRFRF